MLSVKRKRSPKALVDPPSRAGDTGRSRPQGAPSADSRPAPNAWLRHASSKSPHVRVFWGADGPAAGFGTCILPVRARVTVFLPGNVLNLRENTCKQQKNRRPPWSVAGGTRLARGGRGRRTRARARPPPHPPAPRGPPSGAVLGPSTAPGSGVAGAISRVSHSHNPVVAGVLQGQKRPRLHLTTAQYAAMGVWTWTASRAVTR